MIRPLLAWGPAAVWAVVLYMLSSSPDVPGPSFPFADKVGHLGLYGILGATLAWGVVRSGAPGRWRWIAIGWLYGLTDEWHQGFVPDRTPSLADWAMDGLGVAIGFLVFTHLLRMRLGGSDTQARTT